MKVTEHKVLQYIFLLTHSSSVVVSILGNSLVLITIRKAARLHSPSNVLLAGLALSDLGVKTITQPARIVQEIKNMKMDCITSQYSVKVVVLSSLVFVGVSFVTLTTISVDRFLALKLHLRYQELVTVNRALAISLFHLVNLHRCNVLVNLCLHFSAFIF